MIGYIIKHVTLGVGKVVSIDEREKTAVAQFIEGQALKHKFKPDPRNVGRHYLSIGSPCKDEEGRECEVQSVASRPRGEEPIRYGVIYSDRSVRILSEVDLTPLLRQRSLQPLEVFTALEQQSYSLFRAREEFTLALSALLREGRGFRALLSSRVDLRPHQAYVAGVVIQDPTRRYILADEVGLGKTIEAGIVIHDLLAQKPDARVLVICPGALTQQWLCEMYAKFGGHIFRLLDNLRGAPDWTKITKAIVSTTVGPYQLANHLASIRWDMVVVDEVHHLLSSTVLYDFVHRLSRSAPSILLLSAIPAQRRENEFLRLLALLEPGKYNASDKRTQEQFRTLFASQTVIGRELHRISRRVEGIGEGDFTPEEVVSLLNELIETPALKEDDVVRSHVKSLDPDSTMFVEGTRKILHHIGDEYRINRRILRNRRKRLINQQQIVAIERKCMPQPYTPKQLETEAVIAVEELLAAAQEGGLDRAVLLQLARLLFQSLALPSALLIFLEQLAEPQPVLDRQGAPEKLKQVCLDIIKTGHMTGYTDWDLYCELLCNAVKDHIPTKLIKRVTKIAENWLDAPEDVSRWDQLVKLLKGKQSGGERIKVIVFAGYPGIAVELAEKLQDIFGKQAVVTFHSDMEDTDKEECVTAFRTKAETWVLVTDETGGEGRNFQFVDEIIHFDNPWYASKIEQRIGRLDRLGREEVRLDVTSHVLFNELSVEAGLIHCYRDGLQVYSQSISGLEFALREVEDRVAELAVNSGREELTQYASEIKKAAARERAQDEGEAVLDEASFERSSADEFRRVTQSETTEKWVESSFTNYFRKVASNHSAKQTNDRKHPGAVWKFTPDDIQFKLLPAEGDSRDEVLKAREGTFQRRVAQQRPDLDFFSVGNPIFDAIVQSLTAQPVGRTYAIECVAAGREPWAGFEYAFYATPDLQHLNNSPGLINQAMGVFTAELVNIFFGSDGKFVEDGHQLLKIRRSIQESKYGVTWWNLTGGDAQVLLRTFGDGGWGTLVREFHDSAREKAVEHFRRLFERKLLSEVKRLNELKRRLERTNPTDAAATAALDKLSTAILNWHVELDGIGFLSVNGDLRRS